MPINDPEKSENMRKSIRVYSGSSNRPLAQKIAEYIGVELSGLTLKQFANGEIYARYDETVRGADVFLIQSVAGGNVNDMLMELLIATDAAKRASARSITAVITHYGYARQDRKAGPREPITARLVANLLERAGVNRIITLDLHQGQIQGFFDIPVNHLSALPLFGQYYNNMHFDTDNLVVVSPDVGRAKAAKKLSDMLGCSLAIAHKGRPRHNAGFKAIDELARQAGVTYWKNQAGAEIAFININDPEEDGGKRQIVLVKPQSYMNTSGGPISKLCREYKIKAEELLVIHDELDIPAGDVRVKVGGGHAGHNGLRSIIDKMGSRDFSRIRTGIGNPPGKMAVADYVLKQLRAREAEDFHDTCVRAADAAGLAIVHGVVYARDHVNGAASSNGKH